MGCAFVLERFQNTLDILRKGVDVTTQSLRKALAKIRPDLAKYFWHCSYKKESFFFLRGTAGRNCGIVEQHICNLKLLWEV